jgi:hypothetical protein
MPLNTNHGLNESKIQNGSEQSLVSDLNHDYTACCNQLGVSNSCLGFCSLKNILDGTTQMDPDKCEADFPSIVRCMAGNRVFYFFLNNTDSLIILQLKMAEITYLAV